MKTKFLPLSILICSLAFLTSCGESNGTDSQSSTVDESNSTAPVYGKMIDARDNHEYKTVVINGNTWMAENLSATHFRNGDEIPEFQSIERDSRTPSWSYYGNHQENGALCGKLYNWYAITDKRGLAPEGWHVATRNEWWESLRNGDDGIGFKIKDPKHWNNTGLYQYDQGNNITGFSAQPGGWMDYISGYGGSLGNQAAWWSSNEPGYALFLSIESRFDFVSSGIEYTGGIEYRSGLSVRCVKDK